MRPLLLTMLLLTSLGLFAQTKISGTVRDNKGKAVAGASIAIRDSYDGATTDSAGRFSFTTTEKGKMVLTVSAIGYKATEEGVVLDGTARTFSLVIREEVNETLARHPEIDASEVEVRVQNGEVTLTGTVDDRRTKRLAEDIVENVFGVNDVENKIKVKGGGLFGFGKDKDKDVTSKAERERETTESRRTTAGSTTGTMVRLRPGQKSPV